MHKILKELTYYKKSNISGGVVKNKDGNMCYDIEEKLSRWTEYIDELYEDHTRKSEIDNNVMNNSQLENEPTILMSEMRASLDELAKEKVPGQTTSMRSYHKIWKNKVKRHS